SSGAGCTALRAWRADDRAEFHHRLVEPAGTRAPDQSPGEIPQLRLARLRALQPARQDPADGPVHHGLLVTESDRPHRTAGVSTHPGKTSERIGVPRESAPVALVDLAHGA